MGRGVAVGEELSHFHAKYFRQVLLDAGRSALSEGNGTDGGCSDAELTRDVGQRKLDQRELEANSGVALPIYSDVGVSHFGSRSRESPHNSEVHDATLERKQKTPYNTGATFLVFDIFRNVNLDRHFSHAGSPFFTRPRDRTAKMMRQLLIILSFTIEYIDPRLFAETLPGGAARAPMYCFSQRRLSTLLKPAYVQRQVHGRARDAKNGWAGFPLAKPTELKASTPATSACSGPSEILPRARGLFA